MVPIEQPYRGPGRDYVPGPLREDGTNQDGERVAAFHLPNLFKRDRGDALNIDHLLHLGHRVELSIEGLCLPYAAS